MSQAITADFDVTSWDQETYDAELADGPSLARATVRKTYRGALEGEGVAQLLTCQADPADLAAGAGYIASEEFRGQLDGHQGSFVMQHWGLSGGGSQPRTAGHIVPGSATGALAGLTGTLQIDVDTEGKHSITLDYELK